MALFGVIGVILAVVGVYGVVAYSANQRTQEVGIRIALGARNRDIYRIILGQGMVLIAAGSLGAWLVFRIVYYADLVPNTFHLKNVTDLAQGLVYLGDTLVPYRFGRGA